MIVTFATQKGGVGKTTLAVAFANYLSIVKKENVKVFDFDFQKSFFHKWKEDEELELPKLYEVETLNFESDEKMSFEKIVEMKSSSDWYLFDLAGTLDDRYVDILTLSDFIIIPFEYSDFSVKSTLVFLNILEILSSEANRIFIRSRFEKNFSYPNKDIVDKDFDNLGKILENPVYKRNILQSIGTRRLNYEQKKAVEKPFEELIEYINEYK